MLVVNTASALSDYLNNQKLLGQKIGFVPTMGALHQGHISLIEICKKENDITVCSIFVNPLQFNNKKDFEKYPMVIDADKSMLEKAGCDVLFLPDVYEIYPRGTDTKQKHYELGFLDKVFEAEHRPGHFQGVCAVVDRLLTMVMPHNLYLGQKDYQQCMVIKQLVNIIGLDKTMKVNICPTIREASGLAMSSRNMRLNNEQRQQATAIYNSFLYIKDHIGKTSVSQVEEKAKHNLINSGFALVEYFSICNAITLEPLSFYNTKISTVILAAAFLGDVRLIDNFILNN